MIDRFLSVTYAESEDLAPGLGPCLVVLGDQNVEDALATTTTTPGSSAELPPSPFIGMCTAAEVAERLGAAGNGLFVVMDSQSAKDDTVLLVNVAGDDDGDDATSQADKVQTVRATFASTQSVLVALHVGSQGFREVQLIAADLPDRVYGAGGRGNRGQRGGPAPRKRLGSP